MNGTEQWGNTIHLEIFKSQKEREKLEQTGVVIKGFEKTMTNEQTRAFIDEQLKDIANDFQVHFRRGAELEAHVSYLTDEETQLAVEQFEKAKIKGTPL